MYEQENSREQIIVKSKSFPNVILSEIISATSFFFLFSWFAPGVRVRMKIPAGSQIIFVASKKMFLVPENQFPHYAYETFN